MFNCGERKITGYTQIWPNIIYFFQYLIRSIYILLLLLLLLLLTLLLILTGKKQKLILSLLYNSLLCCYKGIAIFIFCGQLLQTQHLQSLLSRIQWLGTSLATNRPHPRQISQTNQPTTPLFDLVIYCFLTVIVLKKQTSYINKLIKQ